MRRCVAQLRAQCRFYVAPANTIIGAVMIALALLGVLAQVLGVPAAVGAILGLSLLGVAATRWTPEPEDMARRRSPA